MNGFLKKWISFVIVAIMVLTNCFVVFAEKNDITYDDKLGSISETEEKFKISNEHSIIKGNWIFENRYWYYYVNGEIYKGWIKDNKDTYYMNSSGEMETGWKWIEDAWYYFKNDGSMVTGWLVDNGEKYYLLEDGKMGKGFLEVDNNKYYMNFSGEMETGWLWIEDAWYYFKDDGSMVTGWLVDNGEKYYLLEDGKMGKGFLEIDNNKYYMNFSGEMETGWLWIEDAWYYFKYDGSMVTGWLVDNGEKYYLLEDGKMKTGWLEVEGKKYFFLSNGSMVVGWTSIEGVWNQFSENGEFIGIGEPPSEYPVNGIDVSYWQGDNIDWNAIKASGIEFVMIRSNFGWTGVDKRFKQNIEGAKAAGLKVGVYLYSYATNVTEASWEFDNLMRTISGYELDYPVAYDIEDPTAQGNLPIKELTDIAVTFCEKVKEAGYTPMVYGSVHWLENKLDYNRIKDYKIWVAQYNSVCKFDYDYNIWQYTSQGRVDGIDGNVDRNICYKL